MIQLEKYCEMLHDIRGILNSEVPEELRVEKVVVSPTEGHLVNKLKDADGVVLCSNYPAVNVDIVSPDNWPSANECIVYLLQKVAQGGQTDAQERAHYAALQEMMITVIERLIDADYTCDYEMQAPKQVRMEWEFQIYGGFNGVSISFNIHD